MKKAQSLKGGVLFIIIAMSIFSFAMFSSPDKMTGNIAGITGIDKK